MKIFLLVAAEAARSYVHESGKLQHLIQQALSVAAPETGAVVIVLPPDLEEQIEEYAELGPELEAYAEMQSGAMKILRDLGRHAGLAGGGRDDDDEH